MRIDPRHLGTLAAAAAPRARGAGETFKLGESGGSGEARQTRSAAPLATLDAILMLQEEDPRERRRRSARRGQDILDALDGLKAALLAGTVPAAQLRQIAANIARAGAQSGDPGLDAVIAAIELRAKVELAKLGQQV